MPNRRPKLARTRCYAHSTNSISDPVRARERHGGRYMLRPKCACRRREAGIAIVTGTDSSDAVAVVSKVRAARSTGAVSASVGERSRINSLRLRIHSIIPLDIH